jgi:hypothetical protein
MKRDRIIMLALLVATSAGVGAGDFPPGWFEGRWVASSAVEPVACDSGAGVAWQMTPKCGNSRYQRTFLANGAPVENPGKASCVNPAEAGEYTFPAQKIDENTFVVRGRPYKTRGRQTVVSPKYFHRCERR